MSLEIDYLPVATGGGANVDSQANFTGASYQTQGFTNGVANPQQANKIWRQASMIGAAIANFISNQLGIDVLDDGNLAGLITNLTNALGIGVTQSPGDNTTKLATTAFVHAAVGAVGGRGTFTAPGGSLGAGGQTIYDSGVAVSSGQVAARSVSGGAISALFTYEISVVGGTIKLIVSNPSSSTLSWPSVTYNYVIL